MPNSAQKVFLHGGKKDRVEVKYRNRYGRTRSYQAKYEGIILDPPKYGRGPDGQVWRLFEDLPELAGLCAELLSENAKFLVLNAYAERISGAALAGLLAEKLADRGGRIAWGELALEEERGEMIRVIRVAMPQAS